MEVDEHDTSNVDETHFIVNIDNGHTRGCLGDYKAKYADFVSGGEFITIFARLSGGRDARIVELFMAFTNNNRICPIKGMPDCTPRVAYRSAPKGRKDTIVMNLWLGKRLVIYKLPNKRRRVVFIDKYSEMMGWRKYSWL